MPSPLCPFVEIKRYPLVSSFHVRVAYLLFAFILDWDEPLAELLCNSWGFLVQIGEHNAGKLIEIS